MSIAAARAADLPAVRALLAANGLPQGDLTTAHLASFWVARDAPGLAGCVGIERAGRAALLRSLAVREDARRTGLGAALLARAEAEARALGVDTLYLLTTGAERYLDARGYEATARYRVPPEIGATSEFAGLCPASAVCMSKRLAL